MSWLKRKRKVTEDYIECFRCHAMNSKYRDKCWRCGEELR